MALNFGPALCARPESGLCRRPATCSLRAPWLIQGAGPAPSSRGRKKLDSLQGRLLTPDLMSPRTGVGCKSRCLRRGSFLSPADGRWHCLFTFSLTGAPSTDLCSLGFGATPSLCDKPTRESFHYLMFNYYLGNGLELSRALLRRACPRQTLSCGLVGCPSAAVLAVAGRRAGGGGCSGLSAAPYSQELALVPLETTVRQDRGRSPSALEGLVSVPGTPDSCVQLLRKP